MLEHHHSVDGIRNRDLAANLIGKSARRLCY